MLELKCDQAILWSWLKVIALELNFIPQNGIKSAKCGVDLVRYRFRQLDPEAKVTSVAEVMVVVSEMMT